MNNENNCNSMLAHKKIINTLNAMFVEYPYYYYMIAGMSKIPDYSIDTIGVSLVKFKNVYNIIIKYNPNFILSLVDEQLNIILQHEVLHILLKHLYRMNTSLYNSTLVNIAMDIQVNHNILDFEKKIGKLYQSLVTKDKFKILKKYDIDKLTCEEIYNLLIQHAPKINIPITNHFWQDGNNANNNDNTLEQELAVNQVITQAVKNLNGKHAGNIPNAIQRLIQNVAHTKFNWRKYISIFVQNLLVDSKRHTYKKINRRIPIILAGQKKEYKATLLVALDNSGSTQEVYQEFINHIATISKIISVDAIGCDCKINFEYTFKNGKIPSNFQDKTSGGGTLFQPVFDYAKNKKKYTGIIYLTDGYNFDDTVLNTYKIPVLFAICPNGQFVQGYKNIKLEL